MKNQLVINAIINEQAVQIFGVLVDFFEDKTIVTLIDGSQKELEPESVVSITPK